MSVTKLRQEQVKKTRNYLDNVTAGEAALVTAAVTQEDDLNALRSQINRFNDSAGNWYDDLSTIGGSKRGLKQLATDLNSLETLNLLFSTQVLSTVAVGSSVNYVTLSVSGGKAPTEDAATATGEGAVVAVLGVAEFGAHRLTVVTGPNAMTPHNLVHIRDAATNDVITSNGQTVFGLLQAENGVVNGDTFNDTDQRIQISFVRNDGDDAFEAVPTADIQNKNILYAYATRKSLANIPQHAYLNSSFADHIAAAEVTLQNAFNNQATTAVSISGNVTHQIAASKYVAWDNESSSASILKITNGATDTVDIVGNSTITGNHSVTGYGHFDTGDQTIKVGETAGQIDSAASLTLAAVGASSDLILTAGQDLVMSDDNKASSSFTSDFVLSDSVTEWTNFESAFGEVSLINAITQAANSAATNVAEFVLTGNISADGDFTPGDHTTISGSAPDWTTNTLATAKVYVNGLRKIYGTNYDFEAGTTPADGDIEFNFALFTGDHIVIEYV